MKKEFRMLIGDGDAFDSIKDTMLLILSEISSVTEIPFKEGNIIGGVYFCEDFPVQQFSGGAKITFLPNVQSMLSAVSMGRRGYYDWIVSALDYPNYKGGGVTIAMLARKLAKIKRSRRKEAKELILTLVAPVTLVEAIGAGFYYNFQHVISSIPSSIPKNVFSSLGKNIGLHYFPPPPKKKPYKHEALKPMKRTRAGLLGSREYDLIR